jgi:hypothetical protein
MEERQRGQEDEGDRDRGLNDPLQDPPTNRMSFRIRPKLEQYRRRVNFCEEIFHCLTIGPFIFSAVQRISILAPAPRKPPYAVSPASGGSPFQHGGLGSTPVAAKR